VRIAPLPVPTSLHDRVYCVQLAVPRLQNLDWEVQPRINAERIRARYGTRSDGFCQVPHPII